jgi:hypothetical protein
VVVVKCMVNWWVGKSWLNDRPEEKVN